MFIVVSTEAHFCRTPDGRVWTQAAYSYRFWQRYLEVFDGVQIAARVKDVPSPPLNSIQVDGLGVAVTAVPDYRGPWQYLRTKNAVRRAIESSVGPEDAIIMRVPSQLANCLFPIVKASSRPYGVEVVGDPWDVFAPGVVRHPLRPFFRHIFRRQLKYQCANACAAAYVTDHTLQQRYPVSQANYNTSDSLAPSNTIKPMSVGVSDVELPREGIVSLPRRHDPAHTAFRLVMVGSLAQLYKGTDVAIETVHFCVQAGLNVFLTIIGDGKYRAYLERLTARLGLTERVVFRGQLPQGKAVYSELDRNDLFIMPSRTEGLPRALIEAMSRGLPCIGTHMGGIPELLEDENLFPPNDARALAAKINEVTANPSRMNSMSIRNLERAKDFQENALHNRRVAFYSFVCERTEEWIRRNNKYASSLARLSHSRVA